MQVPVDGGSLAAAEGPSIASVGGQQFLNLEVVPEMGLRSEQLELILGTPINQVMTALQNVSRSVKNVELIYSNNTPFEREISITLRNNGIRMYFDPCNQLLKLIEVFDFKTLTLHFCNQVFSSPRHEANVSKIEACFGPTHPGVYDDEQKMYLLYWRGISFFFPAKGPSTVSSTYAHGLGSLNFSNNSLPLLQKMKIFLGNAPDKIKIPETPPMCVFGGNCYPLMFESIIKNGKIIGLQVKFLAESADCTSPNNRKHPSATTELVELKRDIFFGDTEQTVLCALGAPAKIYYKAPEKMLIQRASPSCQQSAESGFRGAASETIASDFFFNYFSLGLDLLFDFQTRRVIKFILHTNITGHFDFGIYNRANFSITPGDGDEISNNQIKDPTEKIIIRTDSKLEDIRDLFLGPVSDEDDFIASVADTVPTIKSRYCKPVILNKCVSALDGENPFGSTFCYGTKQLIVEITDNSHIASLTVIEPN